jgi:hypothetical protein
MAKVISFREAKLDQIAECWENLQSIYYWGLQDADGNLCIQDILMDFRKDAVQLRKLYNISLSEIKSLGKIKHQIKYEM